MLEGQADEVAFWMSQLEEDTGVMPIWEGPGAAYVLLFGGLAASSGLWCGHLKRLTAAGRGHQLVAEGRLLPGPMWLPASLRGVQLEL